LPETNINYKLKTFYSTGHEILQEHKRHRGHAGCDKTVKVATWGGKGLPGRNTLAY